MSNGKLGSSSYEAGDTGGSCGDYEHGVSAGWISNKLESTAARGGPAAERRMRRFSQSSAAKARSLKKKGHVSAGYKREAASSLASSASAVMKGFV